MSSGQSGRCGFWELKQHMEDRDRQYLIHQPHSRIDWDMQQKPLKDLFRSIWLSQFSIQPSQTVLYSIIVLVNNTISNNPVTYSDPG